MEFENAIAKNAAAFADLEEDPARLREFAFGTHSRIYVDSGLGHLPLADAMRITFTVDTSDLLSMDGARQIFETMVRLADAYPEQHRLINEAANIVPNTLETVPEWFRTLGQRRGIGGINEGMRLDRTGGIDGSMRW